MFLIEYDVWWIHHKMLNFTLNCSFVLVVMICILDLLVNNVENIQKKKVPLCNSWYYNIITNQWWKLILALNKFFAYKLYFNLCFQCIIAFIKTYHGVRYLSSHNILIFSRLVFFCLLITCSSHLYKWLCNRKYSS